MPYAGRSAGGGRVYYVVALIGVLTVSTITKFFWYRRTLHGGGA